MPGDSETTWHGHQRWTHRSYLLGALLFVGAAALNLHTVLGGSERLSLMVGEAFIAAGWFSGLLGLLGLYAGLRARNEWIARIGLASALIGVVSYAVLAVASILAYVQGGGVGDLPVPFVLLFPGMLVGSLVAFVTIAILTLRSDVQAGTVGGLLLAPPAIFVSNFFVLPIVLGSGPYPAEVILLVTSILALVMGLLGYVLGRTGQRHSSPEPMPEQAWE